MCYVAKDELRLLILLSPPPKCWGYRCATQLKEAYSMLELCAKALLGVQGSMPHLSPMNHDVVRTRMHPDGIVKVQLSATVEDVSGVNSHAVFVDWLVGLAGWDFVVWFDLRQGPSIMKSNSLYRQGWTLSLPGPLASISQILRLMVFPEMPR